jgi:uncharacterized protein (TIGR02588 family)
MAKRATPAKPRPHTPLLEWVVAAFGLLFVVGAIGLVLAEQVAGAGGPPELVVQIQEIRPSGSGWLVRFEAHNQGREAAAEVQVTGRLVVNGEEIERRSVVLDYVPGGGKTRGGLQFRTDPGRGHLELATEGYREP